MTDQHYSKSTRRLVLATAISLALCGTDLLAQTNTSSDSEEQRDLILEEVIVTGSRIRNADPVGSAVISLSREDITASGAVTVDRIIREVPQIFDLGVSENSRAQSGGAGNIVYSNSANLRGLGPYATLIIVDGHRVVNNNRSVDPSMIPTLGADRVEILADGASAIYGSDAVAGVVNIIQRRDLDGAEVLGRYGISEDGDFDEYQVGAAIGKVWDTGQFMMAYEHVYRSNLNGLDRDFFVNDQRPWGGNDYRTTLCSPGTITAGGVTYAIPQEGLTAANAGSLVPGSRNLCNTSIGQDLFPEQEYDSLNSTWTVALTDRLSFYGDAFYSKRDYVRNPGYATATLAVPNTNAFYVAPPGFTGTTYNINYNFVDDLPRDTQTGSAENWQITPGLRYDIGKDWMIQALVGYGQNDDSADTYRAINNGALGAALRSSDPATAFDPYGLHRTSASVLAAISDQIFLAPTTNDFIDYQISADGSLMELPGGSLKLAVGVERQELETNLGSARGGPTTPVVFRTFDRNINSAYAEFLVPFIGLNNARSGARRLEITAAVRYDDYDDVGDTTNPKFGINWAPIDELTFRATYGTSFRAPLISQIYGNSNALFGQNYQNPLGGAPLLGFAYSGPNTDLKPETADTWTAGFNWYATDNLFLSLTYFDIEYEDQVEAYLSDLLILNKAADFEGTGIILYGQDAANRVKELLAQGIPLARGSFPGGDPNNVNLFVDGRNNNLGRTETNGFDFAMTYNMTTDSWGDFKFFVNGMWMTSYDVSITPDGELKDYLNKIFQPAEFRSRVGVVWNKGDWRTELRATYLNSYDNNGVNPEQSVSSYMPFDLSVAWNVGGGNGSDFFSSGLVLGFEVRNLFDEDPPYVNIAPGSNGSGGYDATASNPIGRLYSINLRKSWN
ncbi:MAG TPA: TonB-dependent receptor [Xanthomonadales bacterium]|nr:TonB-dependent receptor [Xanthomonadales bacterium]